MRIAGPFYGWYIVAALFFSTLVSIGVRSGFGVFVETWQQEFGTGVATISFAAAVGWLMNGLSQPLMGRLTDRYGGRYVLIVNMIVMGLGTAAMALSDSVVLLTVFYGIVVSFAAGGVSFTPAGAVVARWFTRQRGTAMAILTAGGSAGGFIVVPLLAYLLILTSWQTAWLIAGGIVLLVGTPLLVYVVRSDPADLGIAPGGDADTRGGGRVAAPRGPLAADTWRDAFRSWPMWQLSIGYSVCGVTTASIAVHYVRWAVNEGISPATAALAFGVLSAINGVGVVVIGIVSDRMPRKNLLALVYFVRALAFLALVVLPGPTALWVFAVVGGMSWLATVPLTTSLTADVYGLKHLGTLAGLTNLAHQIGGSLAAYAFGVVFDRFGSYDAAFLVGALLLGLASAMSLSVRERRYSIRFSPVAAADRAS